MKLFYLAMLPLFLFSCDCGEDKDVVGNDTPLFLESYVVEYVAGDPILHSNPQRSADGIELEIDRKAPNYRSYMPSCFNSDPEVWEQFGEIATRNNDLAYDRSDLWQSYHERICPAEQYARISIICPHAAWDDTHPAGTELADIVQIEFYSFAAFIGNGYSGEAYKVIKKRISDLHENDLNLAVIQGVNCPRLHFDTLPPSGAYTLNVKLVTTAGKEYETYFLYKI